MSERLPRLGPLVAAAAIFVVAIAVRAFVATRIAFPVPEDSAYYPGVARNLLEGRGLVSDALWSYQTQPLVVPRAAFEVWLPLPTLLEAIPMTILGAANWFRAAQLSAIVLGAIVAVLAARLGADVAAELRLPRGRAWTMAVGAGVVASLLGPLVVFGALPDSTMPFAALALAAALLMSRLAPPRAETAPSWRDRRVLALGLLLGLAALTRNEAVWLALTWLVVAWRWIPGTARERLALVAAPAVVAILVYAPWAIRDWAVFGSPLPGQAVANALSVTPYDVYAYQDQPTLARYLAQGLPELLGSRIDALVHNIVSVLVLPAIPTGPIGLLALPWTARLASLRPLAIFAALVFAAATLLFPVSTTWGTFLHAAGAIHVLLLVSCLVALDRLIAAVHEIRHWTRPVAWLGPGLAAAVAVPLLAVAAGSLEGSARDVNARYAALPAALAQAGAPLDPTETVIADYPIWLSEGTGVRAIALPEESPEAVLALARRFGVRLVVVQDDGKRTWPGVLSQGGPAASCYRELPLTDTSVGNGDSARPLAATRVLQVVCR